MCKELELELEACVSSSCVIFATFLGHLGREGVNMLSLNLNLHAS